MPVYSHDRLSLAAGKYLFREGEAGPVAFLIESGRIEVYTSRDGTDHRLALRGPGELIGEMAIIDDRPRSASARVVEDCELVVITGSQLSSRIAAMDPILRMCLTMVIDRYRETLAMLGRDGAERVAASLRSGPAPAASPDAMDMLVLGTDLDRALRENELAIYFQPIIHLRSERLAGFEALMRWNHPVRGMVMPGQFIPIAEATGQIVKMTAWCFRKVAQAYPEMMTAALANVGAVDPLFVSVNVSAKDLARPGFASVMQATLEEAGIAPHAIKLEVTESMLMTDALGAHAVLGACRDLGMGIAIDDFGTGYSSLSNLSKLPINTLKIDRAFVSAMNADPASHSIVQIILRMATEMRMSVVAEGIEDREAADALTALGCEYGQGYLFGRPVPLAQTLDLVRGWTLPQPIHARVASNAR